MGNSILLIALSLITLGGQVAFGQNHQCSASENSASPRRSICKGAPDIPGNLTRQFRDQSLQCSSNSDVYIRRPQKRLAIHDAWMAAGQGLKGKEKQLAMQQFAQKNLPPVAWSGRVPYQTVETWNWTECVYGQDSSCGTYECNCRMEECNPTTTTNADGTTSTTYDQCRICDTCTHDCWHNQARSESRHCSNEVLTYDAQFVRPDPREWNPDSEGYYDIIPNKYDLMPAEVEAVQVFSNNSFDSSLSPYIKIGDAWNEYNTNDVQIQGFGASVRCEDKVSRHAQVNVHTIRRKTNKKTPNAFKVIEGEDPLEYDLLGVDENGKEIHGRPTRIKLVDVAATMIYTMAEQNREFEGERLQKKTELGTDSNMTAEAQAEEMASEDNAKNTMVRVRLFRDRLGRDRKITQNLPTSDLRSVQFNADMALSDDAERALSDYWEIDLDGTPSLYHPSTMMPFLQGLMRNFNKNLAPNARYKLMISMFQKNIPFYAQGPQGLARIAPVKDWRDNSFYSNDLVIPFRTGNYSRDQDRRNLWERINDWHGEKWQWLRFND